MNIEINKEVLDKIKSKLGARRKGIKRRAKSAFNKNSINKSYYILLVFMVGLASVSIYTNLRNDNSDTLDEKDVAPVFSNKDADLSDKEAKNINIDKEFTSNIGPPINSGKISSCEYNDGITKIETVGDEQVVSVADGGIVENIYLDYSYGYTVVVRYSDNIKCKYSNLNSNIYVTFNQKLKKGDVIGRSVEYSLMDESYVYFSAYYNNEPININNLMGI